MGTIKITDKAKKAIISQASKEPTKPYLRLGIKGGGCSGFSFLIQFERQEQDNDVLFDFDGAKIIIDPKSLNLLNDATLDYNYSLMKSGFKITSPNIESKCGCGKSISFKSSNKG